jgi:hypothetical protein
MKISNGDNFYFVSIHALIGSAHVCSSGVKAQRIIAACRFFFSFAWASDPSPVWSEMHKRTPLAASTLLRIVGRRLQLLGAAPASDEPLPPPSRRLRLRGPPAGPSEAVELPPSIGGRAPLAADHIRSRHGTALPASSSEAS